MINLHERMLPTLAGVDPATSWSPVRQRIQLSHRGRLSNFCFSVFKFWYKLLTFHHKFIQGQPIVIIWITLLEPESLMLHTKFQGLQPFKSWEENFQRVLPYMGMVNILIIWPKSHKHTFISPSHKVFTFNLVSISPAILEKIKILNLRYPGQSSLNDLDFWKL